MKARWRMRCWHCGCPVIVGDHVVILEGRVWLTSHRREWLAQQKAHASS